MKKHAELLVFLVAIIVTASASYLLGEKASAESIARSCYLDNGFDADGIAFWCGDVDDYAAGGEQ